MFHMLASSYLHDEKSPKAKQIFKLLWFHTLLEKKRIREKVQSMLIFLSSKVQVISNIFLKRI